MRFSDAILAVALSAALHAQTAADSFQDATKGFTLLRNYAFGKSRDHTVRDLEDLAENFIPYGIAGTTVINQEWQRYQPFNRENFVFTSRSLDLTATIPPGGGLFAGGIRSGQIWSKEVFQPGVTGHLAYAFEIRMKIPNGGGMWPAFWLFSKEGRSDGSEIDHPEFFVMTYQNQLDWTGSLHGPGVGPEIYSLRTNPFVWHPGIDFSADYHNYQTVWTPDAVYMYVDGALISARQFRWTAPGPAQMGANLAVGSSDPKLIGLKPSAPAEFPGALSVVHIKVWAR